MAKRRKTAHGGRREGAGRKPTLDQPSLVVLRCEARQVEALDAYAKAHGLPSRSAAVRTIVAATLEESDNGKPERAPGVGAG
jgi:hypothetical protein